MMARILIVDDHIGYVNTLSRRIKDLGHCPISAYGGCEAIRAVTKKRPDLILLDYMMPKLNGIETLSKIRSLPEGKTIPIVVISAISGKTLKKRTLAAGGNKFLQKPIDTETITNIFTEFLE
ncbi:MAG: response regulator [Desulfobacteraceae bacterium]|nr:response regulator [Desulfobacteraceae bacterium]